jgi:3-oxoacyl-[acyl-carrier protein] reductase
MTVLFPGAVAAASAWKGIGAAIAKSLSAAGAAIVVNYSSSKEERTALSLTSQRTAVSSFCQGVVAKSAEMRLF